MTSARSISFGKPCYLRVVLPENALAQLQASTLHVLGFDKVAVTLKQHGTIVHAPANGECNECAEKGRVGSCLFPECAHAYS